MERQASSQNIGVLELDSKHIWHPFTQTKTAEPPIPIVRAEGAYLYAQDGSKYLDAISSWWVNLHGHAHPHIAERIATQAKTLEHVMFAGFTHGPACELAERLIALLPSNLSRVFYSDNGSTATETALKIALQYWHNINPQAPRTKVAAFTNGYHGDTVGAMSMSSRGLFTQPFASALFDVEFIDPPMEGTEDKSLKQLQHLLGDNEIACVIYEPHVQAVGDMLVHSKAGLDQLLALCREHKVITIADEVAVGFGRTGPLFVSNTLENKPDMICLAKGITGGFLPLAATVCAEYLFEAFISDDLNKALLHGHTFSGNPIGCAAALANLDLLEDPACTRQRQFIEESHKNFQARVQHHPRLSRCEVIGTILVLIYRDGATGTYYSPLRDRLAQFFRKQGVLLRPFGNMIHVMPPYCVTASDLDLIYDSITRSLEEVL